MDIETQKQHSESYTSGLKYIYLGYNKCCTKTIGKAFRILNFKVYDYEENIVYLNRQWRDFFEKKGLSKPQRMELLREMYQNVEVAIEGPCTFYWKELMEIFPDCKAIFYQRNEDSWYKSFINQVKTVNDTHMLPNRYYKIATLLSPTFRNQLKIHDHLASFLVGYTDSTAYIKPWRISLDDINELNVRRCYRAHNADVLTNCPKDRILVLNDENIGKWEVLCNFLGVSVPENTEWPFSNKGGEIAFSIRYGNGLLISQIYKELKRGLLTVVLGILLMLGTVLISLYL